MQCLEGVVILVLDVRQSGRSLEAAGTPGDLSKGAPSPSREKSPILESLQKGDCVIQIQVPRFPPNFWLALYHQTISPG